ERRIHGAFGPVVAGARKPTPRELVLAARIHAERIDVERLFRAPAPEHLGPPLEAAINRTLQRTVADGGVDANQARVEARPDVIGPIRDRSTDVDVGRFGDVPVAPKAAH